LSAMARYVKGQRGIVMLSGAGADEIMGDYGFKGHRTSAYSCIAGLFPDNLRDVFPWTNFFKGTQHAYLRKEEHVGGSHGIETRYPFLDPDVVQEYLHLSPRLKNSNYLNINRVVWGYGGCVRVEQKIQASRNM